MITITVEGPGTGKTITAVVIAETLSRLGCQVSLKDADIDSEDAHMRAYAKARVALKGNDVRIVTKKSNEPSDDELGVMGG